MLRKHSGKSAKKSHLAGCTWELVKTRTALRGMKTTVTKKMIARSCFVHLFFPSRLAPQTFRPLRSLRSRHNICPLAAQQTNFLTHQERATASDSREILIASTATERCTTSRLTETIRFTRTTPPSGGCYVATRRPSSLGFQLRGTRKIAHARCITPGNTTSALISKHAPKHNIRNTTSGYQCCVRFVWLFDKAFVVATLAHKWSYSPCETFKTSRCTQAMLAEIDSLSRSRAEFVGMSNRRRYTLYYRNPPLYTAKHTRTIDDLSQ